jgi:ubiquinone/menaquinone biosynthesis C-methylase UbiE
MMCYSPGWQPGQKANQTVDEASKRKFFDREARGWDDRSHRDDQRRIRELVRLFRLKPGDRVLDVGTGNGVLLPHLLEKVGASGKVVALDFSWNMIAEAARIETNESVSLLNASAEAIPLKDDTFDRVACLATFAHVCRKKEALKEMNRVLKEGAGRVYIAHLMGKKELAEHHCSAGKAVIHDILPSDSDMRGMMQEAGFKDILIVDRPQLYLASAGK